MQNGRITEFWLFAGLTAVCAVIGLSTGYLLLSLLVGLTGYLAWHLYRLAGLPAIIREHLPHETGYSRGLWSDVITALHDRDAERALHEQDLLQGLEQFRRTAAVLPDAIAILQADGRLIWSNAAAERLLGLPDRMAVGQNFSSLVRDPILNEYLAGGDYRRPLTLSSPGNRSKTLLLHVATLDGNNVQRVIVAQDISRQYHLDVSQRDFIANVSHELRTPLTVITGLLEQIEAEVADSKTGTHITHVMQNQARRMRDLIADLLALTRLETETNHASHMPVNVPELLETIIGEIRTIADENGNEILLDIRSDNLLQGDANELHIAFSNLVINAIRHTPNRAEIRIRWHIDSTGAHFSISDSGEGIPARHIPRLTERFYRVDSSRSRDTGGTGLGLSIVRQVLDKHDARLEISSTVGHGSTFTCHFPSTRVITAPGTTT